jgi:hypothetical protein
MEQVFPWQLDGGYMCDGAYGAYMFIGAETGAATGAARGGGGERIPIGTVTGADTGAATGTSTGDSTGAVVGKSSMGMSITMSGIAEEEIIHEKN